MAGCECGVVTVGLQINSTLVLCVVAYHPMTVCHPEIETSHLGGG